MQITINLLLHRKGGKMIGTVPNNTNNDMLTGKEEPLKIIAESAYLVHHNL